MAVLFLSFIVFGLLVIVALTGLAIGAVVILFKVIHG